jgi:predicted DNA-binding transcriptional regulator AlpA
VFADTEIDPLIIPEQLESLGIFYSRMSIYRMERENRFPQRVRLSPRKYAWRKSEIKAWIDARDAERATRRSVSHSGAQQAA